MAENMEMVPCPICGELFPVTQIEQHANFCIDSIVFGRRVPSNPQQFHVPPPQHPPPFPNAPKKEEKEMKESKEVNRREKKTEHTEMKDEPEMKDIPQLPPPPMDKIEPNELEESGVTVEKDENLFEIIFNVMNNKEHADNEKSEEVDVAQTENFTKLKKAVDPLVFMATKQAKHNTESRSKDIEMEWSGESNVFPLLLVKDKRYFDTIIYFPQEEEKVITAHSFVLAARSPLFQVELGEMEKRQGVYYYEVGGYTYEEFTVLIQFMYDSVEHSELEKSPRLKQLDSIYSPSTNTFIQDILLLHNKKFFDGFFEFSDGYSVEKVGFNRVLLYLFSRYFEKLLEKEQNEFLMKKVSTTDTENTQERGKGMQEIMPTSDPTPCVVEVKLEKGEMSAACQGIGEFIKYIYLNGTYRLDENCVDENMNQKVIPMLLYFSYVFDEEELSVECERVLCQNLLINAMNCNLVFSYVKKCSEQFKKYLVNSLVESMYSSPFQYDAVSIWKAEIVNLVFDSVKDIIQYDKVKRGIHSIEEVPTNVTEIFLRDINKVGIIGSIAFVNKTSELCEPVSLVCLAIFYDIVTRSEVDQMLRVEGYHALLPIITACWIGTNYQSNVQKHLNDLIDIILNHLSKNFLALATTRNHSQTAQGFFEKVSMHLQRNVQAKPTCNVCNEKLGFFTKWCELCGAQICKKCSLVGEIYDTRSKSFVRRTVCYRCHRIWTFLSSEEFYRSEIA
ncbi:hypothetical protein EIN_135820 [Entamoeba invadens IP1]|uniref:BTB domain-containing protein n=1 Tax=Entamoeba invadens IP1 TaxID=370355 RepID=A0A0A1TXE7_ENTIV|nr:hypothetical protein EIN_135820 [Entamoeba invadens IP1]ELP85958.1 hypothetical protein EIN_135820 [Entamoeba invadens IP1]|eukprot:XP_004185304.1 hypothetical protein EIN_135820 [Entamoeba invadens IP1]